ncbi:hypothetical protein CYMTET_30814 [Cymbomonas tetramitiformis]|uniref:Uncharacterized protein n=1 Tax=Cymbomonas tetramitiformis TaxID=36881 RepID=A0AAE0FI92_9CHLO|nr:hypothetical protein CYMTET_30814 [Cymbomonas tetramitiformis]|eukprot:gene7099-8469_t
MSYREKTRVLFALASDFDFDGYIPTVFDNYCETLLYNGKPMSWGLWDTLGQEAYDNLRKLSYPGTDCFLFCFELDNQRSLEDLFLVWDCEIYEEGYGDSAKVLVGANMRTGDDSPRYSRSVTAFQIANVVKTMGFSGYLECRLDNACRATFASCPGMPPNMDRFQAIDSLVEATLEPDLLKLQTRLSDCQNWDAVAPDALPETVISRAPAEHSVEVASRGVSLQWLEEFGNHLGLTFGGERGHWTTTQVVADVIKPLTESLGIRMWDLIPAKCRGEATAFISHAWRAPFWEILSGIRRSGKNNADYVWLDIFAINQHDFRQDLSPENLGGAVKHIGHTIMIALSDAYSLTRSWCMFEVVQTVKNGAKFSCQIGRKALLSGIHVSCENAEAFLQEDKRMIDELMLHEFNTWTLADEFILESIKLCTF